VTLPSYSAISFRSEEEHKAALYDACLLIVNTYNQTEMLEDYGYRGLTSYDFMTFARHIVNEIAEG
jgi:predicted xylose isomerase-like sugar epimerase